jgi:hypothetical protein
VIVEKLDDENFYATKLGFVLHEANFKELGITLEEIKPEVKHLRAWQCLSDPAEVKFYNSEVCLNDAWVRRVDLDILYPKEQ